MFLNIYEESLAIASQKAGIHVNGEGKKKVREEINHEERSKSAKLGHMRKSGLISPTTRLGKNQYQWWILLANEFI
jgi:hypothetical protein